ncbi:ATP-binding domain-containing protein [Streptomyces roseirectus]|uniref:ATP-binding domain-containing protein n=1 Tax=Streptomyces roseirectus TaxID=2768066 RepID=A0A7H0IA08_9ACTN|nr:ATP-binding domain-containing protein [Streptomyces roseirectus]QNP69624.1 ATP-binding domain-containing protein [Streptomyces roseirectus]
MTTANTPVLHPDLTSAQRDCLDSLPLTGNHVVSGQPGSGKSLLAAHRAVHLSLTGRPTFLISRSNLLRQLLRGTLQGLTVPGAPVDAATGHTWIHRHFGHDAPRAEDGWFDWTELTRRAAATLGEDDGATPHLVIDEGQDLPQGFYRLVRLAAASVTVFADECQRLTETNSTLAEITDALGRSTARVEITGNHRNTREIVSLAEHFRTGGSRPAIPLRSGALPVVRHYAAVKDLADDIATMAGRQPRQRIGVIVNRLPTAADLMRRLERAGLAHEPQLYSSAASSGRYRDLDLARPGVVLVHRASAKGLDFDTVVIADAESDSADDPTSATLRMAYYVMITRARERLVLAWQGSRLPRHLEGLEGWVRTR